MTLMHHAAQQDWHAAARILEHRWPEEYSIKRIEVRHSGEVTMDTHATSDLIAQVSAVLEQMFPDDPDVLERFATAAYARLGQHGQPPSYPK